MNRYVLGTIFWIACIDVQAQEAALKDPTAPFNSVSAAVVNTGRPVVKNIGPRWVLDGVLISNESKKALLNGRWYNEQDHINGWQLAQVETAAVVLKQAGKTQRILLFPSLTKTTLTLKPE